LNRIEKTNDRVDEGEMIARAIFLAEIKIRNGKLPGSGVVGFLLRGLPETREVSLMASVEEYAGPRKLGLGVNTGIRERRRVIRARGRFPNLVMHQNAATGMGTRKGWVRGRDVALIVCGRVQI